MYHRSGAAPKAIFLAQTDPSRKNVRQHVIVHVHQSWRLGINSFVSDLVQLLADTLSYAYDQGVCFSSTAPTNIYQQNGVGHETKLYRDMGTNIIRLQSEVFNNSNNTSILIGEKSITITKLSFVIVQEQTLTLAPMCHHERAATSFEHACIYAVYLSTMKIPKSAKS
ncbi:hypothetical protein CPB85DRAFT_293382 [Mucidula mucida]|nr:hypothetical protein CPB85DRAFT_293382 [Mucidula mucida]